MSTTSFCRKCGKDVAPSEPSSDGTLICGGCGATLVVAPKEAKPAKPAPAKTRRLGRFEITAKLGSGAFGAVYRAVDTVLQREVALKVPLPASLRSEEAKARFLREPKAAAQLRHPHIVPVFDAGREGEHFYIAYAYIEGQTLEKAMQESVFDLRRAASLVSDLAEALHYAHQQQVVHRDVKPANVMLDLRGEPHLLDFGLARIDAVDETVTQDGSLLGTPAYMSPEQAEGTAAGPASDQYSLGVVLYQLLTGNLPFTGTPVQVLYQLRSQEPAPPSRQRPNLPRDLETICLKAMAKKPQDRYADCAALADDLRRWWNDEPIAARRASLWTQTKRWARKNRALAGLAATVVLFAAASAIAAVGFFAVYRRAESNYNRAETTLVELQREAEARRATEAMLERRQTELNDKAAELQRRDDLLTEKDAAAAKLAAELAAGKQELDRSKSELEKNKQELASIQGQLERGKKELATTQKTLAETAAGRDALLEAAPLQNYRKQLGDAQQKLLADDRPAAAKILDACDEKLRGAEWELLKRFADSGAPRRWRLTPTNPSSSATTKPPQFDRVDLSPDGKFAYLEVVHEHSQGFRPSIGQQTAVQVFGAKSALSSGLYDAIDGRQLIPGQFSCNDWSVHEETGNVAVLWRMPGDARTQSACIYPAPGYEYSATLAVQYPGTADWIAFGQRGLYVKTEPNGTTAKTSKIDVIDSKTGKKGYPSTEGVGSTRVLHIPRDGDVKECYVAHERKGISQLGRSYSSPFIASVDPLERMSGFAAKDPLPCYGGGLRQLRFAMHPSEKLFACGTGDVYQLSTTQSSLPKWGLHVKFKTQVRPVVFSPDGKRLAVTDDLTGDLIILDASSISSNPDDWTPLLTVDKKLLPIGSVFQLSRDWKRALTLLDDGTVVCWGWN